MDLSNCDKLGSHFFPLLLKHLVSTILRYSLLEVGLNKERPQVSIGTHKKNRECSKTTHKEGGETCP